MVNWHVTYTRFHRDKDTPILHAQFKIKLNVYKFPLTLLLNKITIFSSSRWFFLVGHISLYRKICRELVKRVEKKNTHTARRLANKNVFSQRTEHRAQNGYK